MPSLALCMIVGKGESKELEQCLKSVEGTLFDQIVVTTTQEDPEVRAVAEKYATDVPHFDWVHDFSAARNASFSYATTDYIMWLDADDEILPESYQKLLELKEELDKYDTVMMTYNYSHDSNGNPSTVLPRERIVKNEERMKWAEPIHECLPLFNDQNIIKRLDICIEHRRTRAYDPQRNLQISRKAYQEGTASVRTKFYFGKDLIESGNYEEAIPVLEDYLSGPTDFVDNKAVACIRLAQYYKGVGKAEEHEAYIRKGLSYNNKYAEFHLFLGDIYQDKGETDLAIECYETCLKLDMTAGFSMQADYYKYLPADRLSIIYYNKNEFEKSLQYNAMTLEVRPDDQRIINNKVLIENALKNSVVAPPNIAWLVTSLNPVDPVQRIRRLNINESLKSKGLPSDILYGYLEAEIPTEWLANKLTETGVNVAILSSFTSYEQNLIPELKSRGIKVVYDIAEDILENPTVKLLLSEADLVMCCSTVLANKASSIAPAIHIPDAIENRQPNYPVEYAKKDKPVALFIGMGGNSWLVKEHLKSVIEESGYELKVITEWDDADEQWSLEEWPDQMAQADVVLCPQRVDVQPAKSNVKVTQAQAFGLPVIASPLQAYREVIEHGSNGYLCDTKKEWKEALIELKDYRKRAQIGMNGKDTSKPFLVENVAKDIYDSLSSFLKGQLTPLVSKNNTTKGIREPVSLVVPVYENLEYLKLCLNSLNMNTMYPYHIVISDAGSGEEVWSYLKTLKGYTIVGKQGERLNFSQACNAGIRASNTKYVAVLNSDIIVTKGWLTNVMQHMETIPRLAACGVLSNCDRGWLHGIEGKPIYPMRLEKAGIELVPGMKYEQIEPHLDELYSFGETSNNTYKGRYLSQPWVAAYATIFARSALMDAGIFDPEFQNGCEDLDHCRRLRLHGYEIGQSLGSFVYHFGGISRGAYQKEDIAKYNKEDAINHDIYEKKWAKKKVNIYTGPAWEKWNRDTVDKGMAGSETWAAELGAELSKRGLEVTIYNDCVEHGEVDKDGVAYKHYSKILEEVQYEWIDYTILSRTVGPAGAKLRTGRIDVMVHDIWVSSDKNTDMKQSIVSKYHCLSDWHIDFFKNHHGVKEEKMALTANGVRSELYAEVDSVQKKNKIFYSSSPDRGLIHLLRMWPRLREEIPDLELAVAYGFLNWESAVKNRNDQNEMRELQEIKDLMQQEGINYLDRVDKKTLARHQMESKAWLYPTHFSETFCITAVEAGMAKNAIVTSPYAGITTTLGNSPIYITGPDEVPEHAWPRTQEFQEKFIAEAVKVLKDDSYREECAERVYQKVKHYTWENVAEMWMKEWGLSE
jgi:glycosyltransferase involved in cell wall biosynthesis/tetratricopeptide (TPR) repeat protein